MANSDWGQAYQASAYAVGLVSKLIKRSLTNSDKQHALKEVVGLASDAAAVALNANKGPRAALNLLEQGRGVLAVSLEDIRTDVVDLQQKFPVLGRRYVYLRDELELLTIFDTLSTEGGRDHFPQTRIDRRYEADKELD